MIFILLIFLTLIALAGVVSPLIVWRPTSQNGDSEIQFYQEQLADLEHETTQERFTPQEIQSARAEIGRTLLTIVKQQKVTSHQRDKPSQNLWALVGALIILPLLAVTIYFQYGHPDYRDQPLDLRIEEGNKADPVTASVKAIEADLVKDPANLRAWSTLAPVYMRLGRYDDAVIAYRKTLDLAGETSELLAHFGESLMAAANGQVTYEAKGAFTKAIMHDPDMAMAHYYLGLAQEQAGEKILALQIYENLADKITDKPRWLRIIRTKIAQLKGEPETVEPDTNQSQGKNIGDNELISGMVSRLATRLDQSGGTVEDWLRLIRSYTVIEQMDNARKALATAYKAYGQDKTAKLQLDTLSHELKLGN